MSSMETGRLIFLLLLGGALLLSYLVHRRATLGRTVQQAVTWALIFLGVIAVIGLWQDIRQTVQPRQGMVTDAGRIEVPRANDGHYYLSLLVNGEPVEFMVDTGASQMVLTEQDARRVGIDTAGLAYVGRAMTANGEVHTAPVRLDSVELGPIADRNLRAWVNSGEMDQSLLGMSYLQRWSKIEITGGALVLTR